MLTEAEYYWLMQREWVFICMGSYSCRLCQYREEDDLLCIFRECPKFKDNYRDAAEFEAKTAAKLAEGPEDCSECFWGTEGWSADNAEGRLKHARLAVEAEMEAERVGR